MIFFEDIMTKMSLTIKGVVFLAEHSCFALRDFTATLVLNPSTCSTLPPPIIPRNSIKCSLKGLYSDSKPLCPWA